MVQLERVNRSLVRGRSAPGTVSWPTPPTFDTISSWSAVCALHVAHAYTLFALRYCLNGRPILALHCTGVLLGGSARRVRPPIATSCPQTASVSHTV
jgi:hypothetical protein